MKFSKLSLKVVSSLVLTSTLLIPFGEAKASTISVKLVNYLGNTSSVDFDTQGFYQIGTRFSGKDRFEVAENVASSGWTSAETVFVVNYMAFADALSAAPLAKKYDAPILLTKADTLPETTKAKIQSLKPSRIVIVGGSGSVSGNVENQLRTITGNVERIGGSDRYEVAKYVAEKMGSTSSAIVTNGLVFSDALAIAPYASENQIPILLTQKDKLPSSTQEALQGKSSTIIVGGPGSVNRDVENQLTSPSRISGADRYEVSANIIKDLGLNAETVFLSNGLTFADALTGSVLAAKQSAPLLLVKTNEIPAPVVNIMKEKQSTFINILGGPGSVSETVASNLPNGSSILSGVRYSVKNEAGRLTLYKGTQKIKDFGTNSFTVGTTYSNQNKIKIYGNSTRTYIGNVEFTLENGNVRPINKNLPMEDYLKGVVPIEMSPLWEGEALKAQAVAARTYATRNVGDTINDTQSYQVYGGYYGGYTSSTYISNINNAVDGTNGMVLRYDGKLIEAFFSSSNGGKVLSNINSWGPVTNKIPYLQLKDDPYDIRSQSPDSHKNWTVTLVKNQIDLMGKDLTQPALWWDTVAENPSNATILANMKNWLVSNKYINEKYEVKIVNIPELSFTTSFNGDQRIDGHLKLVYLLKDMSDGSYVMDINGAIKLNELAIDRRAYDIRSMIGSTIMRSPYIKTVQDNPDNWSFTGGGWGHGIGMSQFGAKQMAKEGNGYNQILEFYYPGTTLGY
ncbi:SpoIID/LytB domain-containing protein [Bacillus sp. EB106-08-02-XG196]|uniref:SpoIID/LytB domain-containing protein n=1 Tax=Bacillus sp. EB106-08-02-XG196 TaxID=2737049 RepID=UPI0015C44EAD|nr:SpoIID/LytB domain-containing protein [Bacillus sp. EB106-08-02-XG196]NWQ39487.1 SpoIID/LytB domain-containing protein [Bacillus sp. EB106-08-02-XG196]